MPYQYRPRLLFFGIVAALALRGVFILGGTALIEQFHFVVYLLGAGCSCWPTGSSAASRRTSTPTAT